MSPAGWSRSSHDGSRVAARQLCFGGEEFFAFGDEASLLGGGQGEGGAGLWREFCEGEVVGGSELLLPVGWAEDAPALDGYPEDASDVGGGEDAFGFEELVEALGAGGVGDDAGRRAVLLEPDPGEHLAADGFVADPEDESAELLSFDGVGEGEKEGADAFDVHDSV
jgi:hypothetical protein